MMDRDKLIEMERYDARARARLSKGANLVGGGSRLGSDVIRPSLRSPYIFYEQIVRDVVKPNHRVLELAAGSGMHTQVLLRTDAHVTATDISPESLKLLEKSIEAGAGRLTIKVADMEALPFPDRSFDIVTCAGGLSYGKPIKVNSEINRVLRPGGALICVDSLNHNPIYRLNRWLQYLRGVRTKSTLLQMPDMKRIAQLSESYTSVDIQYFGALSFAVPIIANFFGESKAQKISDRLDRFIKVQKSAFKFVLVARGRTCY